MVGRFRYDSHELRTAVDEYVNTIFSPRCGGIEVVVCKAVEDLAGDSNKLVFVDAFDAAEQYRAYRETGRYSEDFTRFSFVSGYLKAISYLECFCGVVLNQERNIAVVFFDGLTFRNVAKALVGAAPAYFRYMFTGENELSQSERNLACDFARPDDVRGD